MASIDSAWFHQKLADRGASLRDLARFMRLDPSAVSRMLNGERKMSADEQDQIAGFLRVTLDDVAQKRRGGIAGFGEDKQQPCDAEAIAASPQPSGEKMFTEADVIYREGKRWMETEGGELLELHPMFGCMKGTMTIPDGLDLTAPADPDWGKVYEDD